MGKLSVVVTLMTLGALLPQAGAQGVENRKNEVGLVIGATLTPGQTLSSGSLAASRDLTFNSSLALGAEFDHRLYANERISLSAGVDFLASPFDVKLDQPPAGVIRQYAYVFLTPHIRVKFRPGAALSPWLLFGGGYARYREAAPTGAVGFKQGTNTGALEFGGGIDTGSVLRILRIPIGFRLEVRDFYAGLPNYSLPVDASLQHNLVFTGGLLLRF